MGTLRSDENEQQASARIRIGGSLLVRNALLNFIGQVIPLLVGIACIPFVVRGLGTERFGLLSLAWVILGYFSIFDLGLGRATTKFVAEALGKEEQEQLPHLVWTAVAVQSVMGIAGGLVLAAITPLLIEHFLRIPPELLGEARDTFHLLALAAPVILVSASFSGVLEAAQRFDLVNAVRIPSSALTYILPLLGVFLHLHLPGIVALMLAARLTAAAALVLLDLQIMPSLKRVSAKLALFPHLFSYGSWVAVTSAVSPILVYSDRFLIGATLSMAAVAHYTVPYEAVTRLSIVPVSLTMTLFPAFSTLEGIKNRETLAILFARSVKYVLLVMVPIAVVAWLFAEEAMGVWLGPSLAVESILVLKILALGVLLNSLALIPFTLLQGIGRPDLPAKFHLIELPVYVGIAWLLISRWGIAGAAWAWTLRMALDCFLLFAAAFRVRRFSSRLWASRGALLVYLSLLAFSGMAYALKRLAGSLPLFAQALFLIGLLALFVLHTWTRILDTTERRVVVNALKPRRKVENQEPRSV